MLDQLRGRLTRLRFSEDQATAIGFVIVAVIAVAIAFGVEYLTHGW